MDNRKLKATAIAPANIAFIKYWGKKNPKINIPFNDSFSMNLDSCLTTTTVEFSGRFRSDSVIINGKKVEGEKEIRVIKMIDIVRDESDVSVPVKVVSKNNFPTKAGIASSASGFSALSLAASAAAGLNLSKKKLSILARLGSGSASRSIPDGFVWWYRGTRNENSYSVSIAPPDFWKLTDIVAVTKSSEKKVSSTDGHASVLTSPFYNLRQKLLKKRSRDMLKAFKKRDFKKFGELVEEEGIELHLIAMSSKPSILYWNAASLAVMQSVRSWREEGLLSYFTFDAGPNVHVICRERDARKVSARLRNIPGVISTIINRPGEGVKLSGKHLF